MRRGLVLLFLLFSLPSFSQTNEIELDPVTISGSLQPSVLSRTGRNISVVRAEAFSKLPIHSIDDLLKYIPGIEIQMRGPAGSQSDIVLRGGTFQQVLVILDGIRLNDPNTGHFNSYIPIVPAEIDRIEILKGASSAIYGPEAVGGVINIISKSFAASKGNHKKAGTISVTGGEYELLNIHAGGNYQSNDLAIGGGWLSNNSSGQPQRGTRGFFHNNTGSISLKKFFGDNWNLSLRSSYDQRRFSAQNFYTSFVSDTARETVSSQWNQLRLNYRNKKHQLSLNAGLKTVRDEYRYNPKSVANYNRSGSFQAQFTDNIQLSITSKITTGIQFMNRKIRSNDRGDHELQQYAAFIILDQSWNHLSLSPSVRLDHSEIRGTVLVPQINISYQKNKWQWRASAGRTIRDADFTERFNNYNKTLVTGGSIGNPDLVAETSFSYEAGADHYLSKNIKLSFSAFQRRQKKLIDWIPTPYASMPRKVNLSPTGSYALASNIARVNTSGLELDIQYYKKTERTTILSSMGLLWLNSAYQNTTPSFYLSSHARFLVNMNTSIQTGKLEFSVTSVYKNRKPQAASAINARIDEHIFLLNLRAAYSIGRSARLFLETDNLTDIQNSDLLGSRLPGRWLMFGGQFSL